MLVIKAGVRRRAAALITMTGDRQHPVLCLRDVGVQPGRIS